MSELSAHCPGNSLPAGCTPLTDGQRAVWPAGHAGRPATPEPLGSGG